MAPLKETSSSSVWNQKRPKNEGINDPIGQERAAPLTPKDERSLSILKKSSSSKKKVPRRSKSFSGGSNVQSTPVRSNRRSSRHNSSSNSNSSNSTSSSHKPKGHRRSSSNSSLESQASSCTSISPPRAALYDESTVFCSPAKATDTFHTHEQMDWSLVKFGVSLVTGSTIIGSLWVFYMHDDFSRAPGQLLFCPLNLWGSGIVWIILALYPLLWNMHTRTYHHRHPLTQQQHPSSPNDSRPLLLSLQLSSIALLLYGLKTASWVGLDAAVTYFLKQQQIHHIMSGFFAQQQTLARHEEEELFLQVLTIYTFCSWVWTVCIAMPHLLSIGIISTTSISNKPQGVSSTSSKSNEKPKNGIQSPDERQRSSSFLSIMGFAIFLGGFVAQLCVEIPSFLDTHNTGVQNSGWSAPFIMWNNFHNIPEDSTILMPSSLTKQDVLDRGEILMWMGVYFIHAPRLASHANASSKFLILAALALTIAGVLSWGAKSGTMGHWVNECDLSDLETVDSMGSLHDTSQGTVATIVEAALTRYNIFSNPIRSFRLVVEVNAVESSA